MQSSKQMMAKYQIVSVEEPQYVCHGCDEPIVGPPIIYRSKVACSISCESKIDRQLAQEHDHVSDTVEMWITNLPRRLR